MSQKQLIRTLLVDDEAHIRLLMKTLLSTMGCEIVAEAGDGEQALVQFRAQRPQVTLLDINMPKMDGVATLEAIRAEFPDAFVIMLTSLTSMAMVERCLDLGAANYLRKDTPLEQMKQEIRESWLDHLAQRQAAGTL